MGYSRIWVAEHHGTRAFAGRAPEVLIPYLAANTSRIRVGSGSVLLNHYSPYKIAENFCTLADLFPGRIDMGIGRATTGPIADIALQRNRSFRQTSDDSGEQLAELAHWLNDDFDLQHPFHQLQVAKSTLPDFWVLGSSPWSASAAAQLGLPYAFAGFINPDQSYGITQRYRSAFVATERKTGQPSPRLILSLSIYCGETEEDAARMAAPSVLMMKRLVEHGDTSSFLASEAEAIRQLGGVPQPGKLIDPTQPPRYLSGTPHQLKQWLDAIAAAYGTEEIMIQCIHPDHERRLHALGLLAEAFSLAG